ncbi:MAG: hypothetical protein IJ588_08810 [Prevotella sp.]|nr:hypothetical protein [Prevotella sp.]
MATYRKDLHLGRKTPVLGNSDIDDGAVTTDKLADMAVTASKIADRSIGGGHINDYVIEARHLNEDSILEWLKDKLPKGCDCTDNLFATDTEVHNALGLESPEGWTFGMAMPIVLS